MAAAQAVAPGLAQAQADTALARQVFAEVNKRLPALERIRFTAKRPGADYPAEGKAWAEAGVIQKIEIIERDDSGDVVSEFYFSAGALIFVYEAIQGFADAGTSKKQVTVGEERFYFQGGQLFKWRSGMGKNATDNPPTTTDFDQAGRSRLAASNAFQAAAQKALSAAAKSK
jgi:hypothetical protein